MEKKKPQHVGYLKLLAFLLYGFSSLLLCANSQPSSSNDASVMLALKKSLNPPASFGWSDPDPCKWSYVGCSDDKRVTRIQIGHQNIQVTGRVTTKVDVFSFGVILMELITGRKALDESQPEESMHLVTWFRRIFINKDSFRKAVDPTIDLDEGTLASVSTVAELAGHCSAREPYQRPDMSHAVNVLSSLVELWKPSDQSFEDIYGIDLEMSLPQALKKWQAYEGRSNMESSSSSLLPSLDNTQTSIPTRPYGFAESFTSADGR